MERLKLSKKLIAIGAVEGVGKTRFAINLANQLAEKEKVLFINWTDYSEKLQKIVEQSDKALNDNLDINTRIGFFDVGSFLEIIEQIEFHNYSTIFIDDINYYLQSDAVTVTGQEYRDQAIKALKFIVDRYSVRIVFNVTIEINVNSSNYRRPNLGDFAWSRLIINDCDQVIALTNLDSVVNIENNEVYDYNTLEVFNLKNNTLEIESIKINLKKNLNHGNKTKIR